MGDNHLVIKDLWHKYGSRNADKFTLKSINISVRGGELLGLVGPSGCGKTTLLRLIAGLEKPSQGSISLNGREISAPIKVVPPEKRDVGMVFQDYALFPHLNAWKNVCFGLSRANDKNRAIWLLELLGLQDFKDRYPHELSGGQKQRLALARALAPGTSIILLDEPFNSLDLTVRIRLRNELSSVLKTCSATGIFVTHDSHEALAICDRVAVINKGELCQCGTTNELINSPTNSFIGEFLFQKNLLPLEIIDQEIFTQIGTLIPIKKEDLMKKNYEYIMFDIFNIKIETSESPNCVIRSLEYLNNQWIVTVKVNETFLRVKHNNGLGLKIGQPCKVSFLDKQEILLFPGVDRCWVN